MTRERSPLVTVNGQEIADAVHRAGAGNPLLGIALESGSGSGNGCTPAELIAAVGARLGNAERRVTASMVVLGYSARLLGPSLAVLLRDDLLIDLCSDRVSCSFDPVTGLRLSLSLGLAQPAGRRGPPPALFAAWCDDVIDTHLRGFIEAVRSVVPVAGGLLWGNVASGATGALRALAQAGAAPAQRCHQVASATLSHGPLVGSGHLTSDDVHLRFTRRSCCLYYRLPGGGTCGDCPLAPRVQR